MDCIEWNNLIAKHLFNDSKAGKNVFVCLTKEDIINLAKKSDLFQNISDDEIWQNFCVSIKGKNKGFIKNFEEKIIQYENTVNHNKKNDISLPEYPFFISYLVFLALPLLEDTKGDYNTTNYYDKLKEFLRDNGDIYYGDKRESIASIDKAWNILEDWTKSKNIGEFHIDSSFYERIHHKFVSKVFSQVILRPNHRETLLPKAFSSYGKPPDDVISLKTHLTNYGIKLKIINDEHWEIAAKLVKEEWEKWSKNPQKSQNPNGGTQKTPAIPTDKESFKEEPLLNPIRIKWKIKDNEIYYSCKIHREI